MHRFFLILAFCFTAAAQADDINVGEPLPAFTIADKGELVLTDDDIEYRPWSTEQLSGKVAMLQVLAGRLSASKVNEPFTDALDKFDYTPEQLKTATVINMDDIAWGTSMFVISELKSKKKQYPTTHMVVDANGTLSREWQLQPKSSAITILDKQGKVLFFKDGAMSDEEIQSVLAMIKQQIEN